MCEAGGEGEAKIPSEGCDCQRSQTVPRPRPGSSQLLSRPRWERLSPAEDEVPFPPIPFPCLRGEKAGEKKKPPGTRNNSDSALVLFSKECSIFSYVALPRADNTLTAISKRTPDGPGTSASLVPFGRFPSTFGGHFPAFFSRFFLLILVLFFSREHVAL